jgi:DNA-binding transcriptional MerR regulator
MNKQPTLRTPQAVTGTLDISPATLRRWADEFSDFLSLEASSAQGKSHRRYTDEDVEILLIIKELLNSGLTYQQVHQQLSSTFALPSEQITVTSQNETDDFEEEFEETLEPVDEEETEESSRALVASNGSESPAIAFLTNTLTTLSDTQQSILNSQAANRELLGVLIQDNFNLKEENNRLRERILDIERSLAQSRQEDEWRRESMRQELDAKIAATQQLANQALTTAHSVEMPEIKAIKGKPGCLGALLGAGGDTQIVTVPRRQKKEGPGRAATGTHQPTPPPPSPPPPTSASPPPPAHPKPTAPPE